ncbi:unnamed protein product [Vitrella brassicaformis CCMP3155]|uniref:Uncharacterized protein n=1 Tax=Vitrella brassicaformis (strain CCMP3155) TaxID=1169540 RepID=A0A0G4FV09_VITBC|nr:unnamed protein product [Vitrella brassicaformis CCMP3155]|eukprot:CEM18802.1 unnamed protein product [Vitrella brassicaformis CCMP3155]
MRPTGAAPSSQPLFQPAELFDLSLPISKMAAMAMSADNATRAALRSQIVTPTRQQELKGHTSATVTSTLLNGVQRHINKAIRRLGLEDVLAFDIGGNVEGGLRGRLAAEAGQRHLLKLGGQSLALQQANNGAYRIGNESFRVVPYGDLPGGHHYADGYKRTDPAIRWVTDWPFPSFSAFLLHNLLGRWCGEVDRRRVLDAVVGPYDYGRLLTEGITEDQGIAVDWRWDRSDLNAANPRDFRHVIVSGFRQNKTVAASVWVGFDRISLNTTKPSAAGAPAPLAVRFPVSEPLWRRVLRPFGLERAVIDRGTVLV